MSKQKTTFQVGDQVIHSVYGLGEIIRLDEKELSGQIHKYFVVVIGKLSLWVPADKSGVQCLRFPTPAIDFQKLFRILASPGDELSGDRYVRKIQLKELLKDGTLASVCRVVRDLEDYKRNKRVNENDNSILSRATNSLLNEWSLVLSVPIQQAERDLRHLLDAVVL